MGPLVTEAHRDKVASYLDSGVDAGRHAGRSTAAAHPVIGAEGESPTASGSARACSTT